MSLSESKLLSSADENHWKIITVKEVFLFPPARDVALEKAMAFGMACNELQRQ